jgi:hypothetical protein
MSELLTALALAMALLFTSSGPGPVGIIDHGEDGVWALECEVDGEYELIYVHGDYREGERVPCPVDFP